MTRGKRDGGEDEDEKDTWRENSERKGRALGGAASAHTLRICLHDSEGSQHDTVRYTTPRTSGGVCVFSSADINEGGPYVTHWKL